MHSVITSSLLFALAAAERIDFGDMPGEITELPGLGADVTPLSFKM